MSETQLVPPPRIVRERLAYHEREVRHLKRLYKLSMEVAESRPDPTHVDPARRHIAESA